jgi:hypothetical protein
MESGCGSSFDEEHPTSPKARVNNVNGATMRASVLVI